eukprot:gene22156-28263_t
MAKKTNSKEPAWGVFHTVSQYNPCDLCSMDKTKVCSALRALVDSPQNNLRVCMDGHHVFGWDKDTTEGDLADVCGQFLLDDSTVDNSASLSPIVDLMGSILCAENTLQRLEQMQSLDLLDVEGAALVFERLVVLTDGDHAEAERLLTKSLLTPIDGDLLHSITQYVTGSEQFDSSTCPPIIMSLTALRISSVVPSDVAEQHRSSALSLVNLITTNDCLLLLTLWMLALVAKDASVIVSLVRVTTDGGSFSADADAKLVGNHSLLKQTATAAGLIRVHRASHSSCDTTDLSGEVFAYCLSLVDVGPKSLHKVWTKAGEEQELYEMYLRGEELNKW